MTDREYNRLKMAAYMENPHVRARVNRKNRERYANDPEYRLRVKTRNALRRADPEYRDLENARQRERYNAKVSGKNNG
jgi:spore coat polysaccharide biosynthesis protein SpsF (cytidylyltransferase family)